MMMDDDAEARIVARLDQVAAWTREVACCVALYFNQLVEDGVPAGIAETLTVEYVRLFPFAELLET